MDNAKILEDVYFRLDPTQQLMYVFVTPANDVMKDYEIAEVALDRDFDEEEDQEYLYNEALNIAHEMGYKLIGEIE